MRLGSFRSLGVVVCGGIFDEEWLKGRVGDRLESWESGEVPYALYAERMRCKNDSESGEVFFIDVESDSQRGRGRWVSEWKWVGLVLKELMLFGGRGGAWGGRRFK
jgi:hypothetical protein